MVEKNNEYDKTLFLAFVDQEKAFIRVNRNKLWQILASFVVSDHLIDACNSLCRNVVRTNVGTSRLFEVSSGVRQ